ncbi:MAG: NusG domain II-containing protein [Fusobacteriaceae bacterium]|jgi:hypothetical protein|nr:NusG domain II-containing protein [Fusobacteriaceae bacterium]
MGNTAKRYFKKGDLILYGFLLAVFCTLGTAAFRMKTEPAASAEIYVSGKLQYVLPLVQEEKNLFVDTVLGGVNVLFLEKMVRVTSSNSPRKLCVKQGWIKNPGETIIGIPDELIIKITGERKEATEIDYVVK